MSTGGLVSGVAGERLRRIEAVTESRLAHLEVSELLDALIDRVRELLAVDTAAVLLLDPSGNYLVATVARGIEEEVRQGVRIPLGKGFAGRIAAEKHAVFIERVDHANVLNPILRERGIHSLLGVPLLVGGSVIGVLHVGTLTERQFTQDDADLLQLVADRIALATQSRLSLAERSGASALQRSLLPDRLPDVPGLEFGARYVASGLGEVGGDWYDVFVLPSDWLCVVVGDVAGRGLNAAIAMGRLRNAVRSYALEFRDPAEVLNRLDRQVKYFEHDVMATVLCAMVAPSHEQFLLSSAGHPPPILAREDLTAIVLEAPADLPLGIDPTRPRRTTSFSLPTESSVTFYTDGLIERRGSSIDDGLARLCGAVTTGDPEKACASVMSAMVGSETAQDDIALLVMSRGPLSAR
jgi:sigma-B regulation protein RsbU (phosphoserine phosphatase)